LDGLVLNRFMLGRGCPCLFRAVSLLRLAAAEISPQRFGETLAAGGRELVIAAGQSHNFLSNIFLISSPNR
jgi:hypothetical protein